MQITNGFNTFVSLKQGASKERELVLTESREGTFDLGVSVGIDNLADIIIKNKISPDDARVYAELLKILFQGNVSDVVAGERSLEHLFAKVSDSADEREVSSKLLETVMCEETGTVIRANNHEILIKKNNNYDNFTIGFEKIDDHGQHIVYLSASEQLVGELIPMVSSAIITTKRVGEYSVDDVEAFNVFFDTILGRILGGKIDPHNNAQNNGVRFE